MSQNPESKLCLPEPLTVHPVRCQERERWRQLMGEHHYLGFQRIVGESLWYVATSGPHWVALLG